MVVHSDTVKEMNQSANFCLPLAGLGMMVIGLGLIIWWQIKKKTSWRWIWWAMGLWGLAVGIKTLFGFFVNARVQFALDTSLSPTFSSIVFFLYIGFLTIFTEVWLTYQIIRSRLAKASFNEAVSFGLGYGGGEAFTIGLFAFINLILLSVMPQLFSSEALKELSLPCGIIGAPLLERSSAIFIHLLASLWLFQAAKERKVYPLVLAALVKGIDSLAPALIFMKELGNPLVTYYLIEVPILLWGIGAVFLLKDFVNKSKLAKGLGVTIFVAGIIFVFMMLRLAPKTGSNSNLNTTGLPSGTTPNPACLYPVVVRGQRLEPLVPDGKRLMMNKCIEDKEKIPEKAVIVFKERDVVRIGMIVGNDTDENGFFYWIGMRVSNPDEKIKLRPDNIIAFWQPE